MARRPKTRFEKFFSLNQHRKRWGAGKIDHDEVNFSELRKNIIRLGEPVQTYGSKKSLEAHLDNLKREFSGRSELIFHHAKLIVLIRREYQLQKTYSEFRRLWQEQAPFLLEQLNLRWLVSACDTIADFDDDGQTGYVAMQGSLLANIIKIYETERRLAHVGEPDFDPQDVARLHDELFPLFGGMSYFAVGTDDTLRNMRWRLDKMFNQPISGPILKEIFDRMQTEDTAFKRMKDRHKRDKTAWW